MEYALDTLWNPIQGYLEALDWSYILTFILMAYGFNTEMAKRTWTLLTRLKLRTRYRTAMIGIVYAAMLYSIREYTKTNIEGLLQSFVFAMIFHKLLIELAVQGIQRVLGNVFAKKPTKKDPINP